MSLNPPLFHSNASNSEASSYITTLKQAQRIETTQILVQIPKFLLDLNIAGLNSQFANYDNYKDKAVIEKEYLPQISLVY